MHISWFGTTSIKLQTKPHGNDVVVTIDTYKPAVGAFPRSLTPDIGIFTRGEKGSITLSGDPYLLSTAGEIDTKEILVSAVEGHNPGETMVRIDAEQMSIGHLGLTNKALNKKQLELLSGVDILFIPVGHKDSFDAEAAVKTVNEIEPRIVIPMAFKSENDKDSKTIDNFLKEIGSKNGSPEKKVIVRKKDLPQEETKVIVLQKE